MENTTFENLMIKTNKAIANDIDNYGNHTKIFKKVRNRYILPHPSALYALFTINMNKQKSYKEKSVISFMDIQRLIYTQWNYHKILGNIVFSYNYLKLAIKHYDSNKNIFNAVFNKEHQGSKFDKLGASTYSLNSNINTSDNVIYTHKYIIKDALMDLLETGDISAYENLYNNIKTRKNNIVLSAATAKIMETKKKAKKDIKKDKKNITETHIIFSEQEISDMTYAFEKLNKTPYAKYNKQEMNSLQELIATITTTKKVDFVVSTSDICGREYHKFNLMKKSSRHVIFPKHLELDVKNEAFTIINNDFPGYERIDYYTKNRTKVIKNLADTIYIKNVNSTLNRKSTKYQNIKIHIKALFLGTLFGAGTWVVHKGKTNLEIKTEDYVKHSMLYQDLVLEAKEIRGDRAKNYLSNHFMKVETAFRKELEQIFIDEGLKHRLISIHDALLVPNLFYKHSTVDKIEEVLKKYNLEIDTKEIRNTCSEVDWEELEKEFFNKEVLNGKSNEDEIDNDSKEITKESSKNILGSE